ANATHRLYEALRAYFVEGASSKNAAQCFGYTQGSFRSLVHQFRQNPQRPFFGPPREPSAADRRQNELRQRVVSLCKRNLSIYDISRALVHDGQHLRPVTIHWILQEEGFARLPRRWDEERPPDTGPARADTADVRQLDLTPRQFRTRFGGLFLFLPDMVGCARDALLCQADFPRHDHDPRGLCRACAVGLEALRQRRQSHVMSHVLDEGLALFPILAGAFSTPWTWWTRPTARPR
ncbi:MAG: hypothetical protein JO112_11210, partial [Planctomycetes bacterium]|nr:hypothetical protein [Planctomycetota bacterium]